MRPGLGARVLARLMGAGAAEAYLGDLEEEARDRMRRGWGRWRVRVWVWLEVGKSVGGVGRVWLRRRAVERRREAARNARGEGTMRGWLQDIRFSARSIAKRPGLAALVVLTLGLGVGAATMVFSVVDNLVLSPFDYPEVDRLVGIGPAYPKLDRELSFSEVISPAEYEDIRSGTETLEREVAWDIGNRAVTAGDVTENLLTGFWWGDAFGTLGVQPHLGRGFTAEEIETAARVAILSHRVWATRFGADSSLVGVPILMNGDPYTLVGVMPPGTLVLGTDLWLPMWASPGDFGRNRRQFQVLARLAEGATLEMAARELELLARRTELEHGEEHPEYAGWRLVPMTWTDINTHQLRAAGLAVLGAIGFVLLVVCANAASMLLARGADRQREMAIRSALGAARRRVLRQLLTESVLLGVAGAVLGLGVAYVGVEAVAEALARLALPVPGEVAVDGRVLTFAALLAIGTGLAFGMLPAWQATRPDVRGALHAGSLGIAGGRGRLRLQRVLVAAEVALAVVLLMGGGLLLNSFVRMQAVDPGFDPRHMLTMRLTLPWERYGEEEVEPFLRRLTQRLEEHPSIVAAATATQFPPLAFSESALWVEGGEVARDEALPTAYTTIASPGYFEAMGIPLERGRAFAEEDGPGSSLVGVVNASAAARYFGGGDALGKRFKLRGPEAPGPWFEVIGVVGDVRNQGLDAPAAPEVYASVRQLPSVSNQHFLLLRTRGPARGAIGVVREAVASLDPQQPIYAIRTVEEAFAGRSLQRRLATVSLALFGVFALLLAAVGIYAVVAHAVVQRTREIGVRVALGADRGRVRRMVIRQALVPVAAGALVGTAGSLAVGRALSGLLFEVGSSDPATLVGVLALFGTMATLASWVPARRAAGLDPVRALRADTG